MVQAGPGYVVVMMVAILYQKKKMSFIKKNQTD